MVGPLEPGTLYMGPSEVGNSSREGTASQDGAIASEEGTPQKNDTREDSSSDAQQSQDLNWVKNHFLFTIHSLVVVLFFCFFLFYVNP